MAPPRVQVEASPVQPFRYGLESVLSRRVDGRWELSGVEMPSEACSPGVFAWPAACTDLDPAPEYRMTGDEPPYDHAIPFTIYADKTCKAITPAEAEQAARRRLAMGEARAVEKAFWNAQVGNEPSLNTSGASTILDAATSVLDAVAQLESNLAYYYDGIGVIHAPRIVAPYAANAGLIVPDGPVLRTPLGTLWAFGAGYSWSNGPLDEDPAPVGSSWMYATGAVARWRTDVAISPPGWAALDLTTNNLTIFAERQVMLYRDCLTLAIQTALVPVPGGGGGGGF